MSIIKYVEKLSDVYGVADFSKNKKKLIEAYGEDICIYPYAIAIGHKMIEEIIENIPQTYTNDKLAQEYLDEYFNSHQRVSKIADKIVSKIKEEGYDAIVLDVSGKNEKLKLTNAPLGDYAGDVMESPCGDCTICVKACPGKAISDLPDPKQSYSPEKCGEYLMKRKDEGHPVACGMCLFICPYGNKKIKMEN